MFVAFIKARPGCQCIYSMIFRQQVIKTAKQTSPCFVAAGNFLRPLKLPETECCIDSSSEKQTFASATSLHQIIISFLQLEGKHEHLFFCIFFQISLIVLGRGYSFQFPSEVQLLAMKGRKMVQQLKTQQYGKKEGQEKILIVRTYSIQYTQELEEIRNWGIIT